MVEISQLKTPAFLIERDILERNIRKMTEKAQRLGVRLRPHVKTHKTVEIARLQTTGGTTGITVSTLAEARFFADAGFEDMIYAFPITPDKLDEATALTKAIKDFHIILDHEDTAHAVDLYAKNHGIRFSVFLKVDPGYHRAGVSGEDARSLALAATLHEARTIRFRGILTHGGHSYHCSNPDEIRAVAEEERMSLVRFAGALEARGIPCPVTSAGSTPTAMYGSRWEGVTELRPGNYVFFDQLQADIGTCGTDDCAASVLATVAGHYPERNQILVNAGALALSKDPGAAHRHDAASFGTLIENREMKVTSLSQEHGLVGSRAEIRFQDFPIGSRVRITPNHSCLAAALFPVYHVVDKGMVIDEWTPVRGW
ncbi:MAG: alanine racemase [Planctomycetota bacterium]